MNSLNYAQKAMNIQNRPIVRLDEKQQLVFDLRRENASLKKEVEGYRARYGALSPRSYELLGIATPLQVGLTAPPGLAAAPSRAATPLEDLVPAVDPAPASPRAEELDDAGSVAQHAARVASGLGTPQRYNSQEQLTLGRSFSSPGSPLARGQGDNADNPQSSSHGETRQGASVRGKSEPPPERTVSSPGGVVIPAPLAANASLAAPIGYGSYAEAAARRRRMLAEPQPVRQLIQRRRANVGRCASGEGRSLPPLPNRGAAIAPQPLQGKERERRDGCVAADALEGQNSLLDPAFAGPPPTSRGSAVSAADFLPEAPERQAASIPAHIGLQAPVPTLVAPPSSKAVAVALGKSVGLQQQVPQSSSSEALVLSRPPTAPQPRGTAGAIATTGVSASDQLYGRRSSSSSRASSRCGTPRSGPLAAAVGSVCGAGGGTGGTSGGTGGGTGGTSGASSPGGSCPTPRSIHARSTSATPRTRSVGDLSCHRSAPTKLLSGSDTGVSAAASPAPSGPPRGATASTHDYPSLPPRQTSLTDLKSRLSAEQLATSALVHA